MRTTLLLLTTLLLAGCPQTRADLVGVDTDRDGYGNWLDCNDDDPAVNPGATEIPYNGVDDDCNADTPDDDLDGDGFGQAQDCDDTDASVNPDASEVCDGRDDDCNGTPDDGLISTWYTDADGDGFGDPDTAAQACDPAGRVHNDADCDDTDPGVHPGALEVCNGVDDNCDGNIDSDTLARPTWFRDADSDGFGDSTDTEAACAQPDGYVADGSDCDDSLATGASVHPGAQEVCDGKDDDCDGVADDNDPTGTTPFYLDADGDGQGTTDTTVQGCTSPDPTVWVTDARDCDDTWAAAKDGGTEVCDGHDDDCDGTADNDATDASTFYADVDADGFGDPDSTEAACTPGAGFVTNDADCDDSPGLGASIHPGGTETCDGYDDDCNGHVDDVPTAPLWFRDGDGDGFGDPSAAQAACDDPSTAYADWVQDSEDCNDDDGDIHPGATETCDDTDDDCDGLVDDGASPLYDWYLDADGDGHGDGTPVQGCSRPSADYVASDDDCDDGNDSIFPGATPRCGGIDADCDTWLDFDADHDGFVSRTACADGLDCDDDASGGATVYPGAGCGWGRSCLEALDNNPAFAGTDQSVELDPQWDGNTGSWWCDFTDDSPDGDGWTLLYWSDFEADGANSGWGFYNYESGHDDNGKAVVTTCNGTHILGGYNETAGGWLHRAVDSAHIPHQEILVGLDYYQIDSWDGEGAFVNLERTASRPAGETGTDSYLLWWDNLHQGDASSDLCGQGNWNDAIHPLSLHSWDDENRFRVELGSLLDQHADDESFGLDNVSVWIR